MNYYPHHIGDFNNATRHLTRIERSIYRDLIELYYDTEKPLTDDIEMICRRILADDEIQVYAVQSILREYFTLTEKGYENARCNEIIKEYKRNAKNKSKAGKASAIARKARKNKEKTLLTDDQHVFNECSTGVRNQEPITKTNNQKPLTKESQNTIGDISDEKSPRSKCPVQKIVDLYHEKLPELPKVEKITTKRRGYIQQRWREDLPKLDNWVHYFDYVKQSDFLMGKTAPRDDRKPFIANLEWLTNPSNFAKVAEEKYHG